MNWRQWWQSTVANVRALFGARPPAPPSQSLVPRRPAALTGPGESYSRPQPLLPVSTPQVIDLARTGSEPPQAPLRRRPQIRDAGSTPVDTTAPNPSPVSRAGRVPRFAPHDDEVVIVHDHDRLRVGMNVAAEAKFRTQAALLRQAMQDAGTRALPAVALPGPVPLAQDHQMEPDIPTPELPLSDSWIENGIHDGGEAREPGHPSGAHPNGASHNGTGGKGDLTLSGLLESLLFVAAEPVDPHHLARSLALSLEQIEQGLAQLAADLQRSGRGLRLQRFNGRVQLVTAPAAAGYIETFLNLDTTTRLSGPALETLAVIAYRQPVTRAQIEAVRGVDCAGVLRSLVQRGLVAEVGRLESVGRPILYSVTELFMQHFGLEAMEQLPPLEETEADRLWAATVLAEEGLESGGPAAPDQAAPR